MEKKYDSYLQIGTKGLGAKALGRRNTGMISLLSCSISYWKNTLRSVTVRKKKQTTGYKHQPSHLFTDAKRALSASSHSQKHKKKPLAKKAALQRLDASKRGPCHHHHAQSPKLSEINPQEHTIKVSPTLLITHKPPHQPSPCAPRPSPSSPPPAARVSPVHSSPKPSKPP
jgi:hypothetical protein